MEHNTANVLWEKPRQVSAFCLADAVLAQREEHAEGALPQYCNVSLSAHAIASVQTLAQDQPLAVLAVISSAVTVILQRLSSKESVVFEVPLTIKHQPGLKSFALPLCISMVDLQTYKAVLLELQYSISHIYRNVQKTLNQAEETSSSDVLVFCQQLHVPLDDRSRYNLVVEIDLADGLSLELSSPSGTIPTWLLQLFSNFLDGVLAQFNAPDHLVSDAEFALVQCSGDTSDCFNPDAISFVMPDGCRSINDGATVIDCFAAMVRQYPDHKALIFESSTWTYKELGCLVDRLAATLIAEYEIEAGDIVASLHPRSHWSIIALLAVLRIGAVYLPLNSKAPDELIQKTLEESGAGLVLTSSCYSERSERIGVKCSMLLDAGEWQIEEIEPGERCLPNANDLAYVIFTSGTTGKQKGVLIQHAGLLNTALDHIQRFAVTEDDVYLQVLSHSFDGYLLDVVMTLCAGAALVVASEQQIESPAMISKLIVQHEASLSTMTPSYIQLLNQEILYQYLRILVSAGEVLPLSLAESLCNKLDLYNGYGPTEASINTTLKRVDEESCGRGISIGSPSANKKLYIVNAKLQQQPAGIVGELCIAGEGLAAGYMNDQVMTNEKFVPNPFGAGRLYRTGDFASWTPEGEILFYGRSDSQIKINGYRVDVKEIEEALSRISNVSRCEILINRSGGKVCLTVCYQLEPIEKISGDELREVLSGYLPHYMIPGQFLEIKRWPLTLNGKTDTRALQNLTESAQHNEYVLPKNEVELNLYKVWQQVLGHKQFGVEDSFFGCGGDSIKVIQMCRMAQDMGMPVQPSEVLAYKTIAQLVSKINGKNDKDIKKETNFSRLNDRFGVAENECVELSGEYEAAYPAAQMQSLMLASYLDAESNREFYHACAEWKLLDEGLDEKAFESALQHLCLCNPILRSCFARGHQQRDILLIKPYKPLVIEKTDLRGKVEEKYHAKFFQAKIVEDTINRFAPYSTQMQLLRLHIYRTGEQTLSLFLSFPQALLDGWSGVELRNQLLDNYEKVKNNQPLSKPDRKNDSYHEFALMEQAAICDPDVKGYWKQSLNNPEFINALAGQRNKIRPIRPAVSGYGTFEHRFTGDFVRLAEQFCRDKEVMLKSFCLSLVTKALMAEFELEDLVCGVVSNGRSESLTYPLDTAGMFWNVLPILMKSNVASDINVVEDKLNISAANGLYPLWEMEKELLGERLVMPCFNFVHFHNAQAGMLDKLSEGVVRSRYHYPLTIFLSLVDHQKHSHLFARLQYEKCRFTDSQMQKILYRFQDLVEQLVQPVT